MRLDLRNRFLLPTTGAVLLAFGVYLGVTTYRASKALEATVHEEMHQLNQLVVNQIRSWMDHRELEVAQWSQLPDVQAAVNAPQSLEADAAEAVLRKLAQRTTDYEGIHLIGADGLAVASSVDGMTGVLNIRERDYFQECLRTRQATVSSAVRSKITGNPSVVVCQPVTGPDGGGAIIGVVDLGRFTANLVDPIKVGKTGYVYICAADGTFLAHPKKELILDQKITQWEFGQEIMAKQNGLLKYVFNGIPRQSAFATEPKLGWTCAVALDSSQIYAASRELRNFGIVLTLVSLLAIGAVIFFVARSVTGPVNAMIADLNAGSQQTSAAAAQISNSSVALAEQSSEQAAAVEETSASLEEMTANVRNTTEAADRCQELTNDAQTVVKQGLRSMEEMVEAISTIKSSADQTARIVGTIDEIAFQTNLLALNAAVEAARAGEAGKGFAVVAEEVRNLAQRSAEAARNTAQLIESSQQSADGGVKATEQVAEILGEITSSVDKVTRLVGEVASASREQAEGIGEINTAMNRLDQVTQTNAASAEESAAASKDLEGQARMVQSSVESLRLVTDGARAAAQTMTYDAPAAPARTRATTPTRATATVHKPVLKAHQAGPATKTPRPAPAAKANRPAPAPVAVGVSPADVLPLDDDDLANL